MLQSQICVFDFIERLCEQTVVKPKESKERIRSEKIDKILTGKYTAIPVSSESWYWYFILPLM